MCAVAAAEPQRLHMGVAASAQHAAQRSDSGAVVKPMLKHISARVAPQQMSMQPSDSVDNSNDLSDSDLSDATERCMAGVIKRGTSVSRLACIQAW